MPLIEIPLFRDWNARHQGCSLRSLFGWTLNSGSNIATILLPSVPRPLLLSRARPLSAVVPWPPKATFPPPMVSPTATPPRLVSPPLPSIPLDLLVCMRSCVGCLCFYLRACTPAHASARERTCMHCLRVFMCVWVCLCARACVVSGVYQPCVLEDLDFFERPKACTGEKKRSAFQQVHVTCRRLVQIEKRVSRGSAPQLVTPKVSAANGAFRAPSSPLGWPRTRGRRG